MRTKRQTPQTRLGLEPHQGTVDATHVEAVPLDLIDQGDQLIRADQNDDEILELAADIARNGLLQPIGVRPTDDGRWQLLYGARRLLAHRTLRRATIPAVIHPQDSGPIRAIAARENMLRRQLSLAEECHVVAQLHHEDEKSPDQIAAVIGRSRSWVLRRLAIPNLPADLREPLLEGDLSVGHAETLSLLTDDGLRRYALTQVRASKLSLADTRGMVEALRADPSVADAIAAGIAQATAPREPMKLLSPCESCGTPQPIHTLRIVRLCDRCCTPEDRPHASEPEG